MYWSYKHGKQKKYLRKGSERKTVNNRPKKLGQEKARGEHAEEQAGSEQPTQREKEVLPERGCQSSANDTEKTSQKEFDHLSCEVYFVFNIDCAQFQKLRLWAFKCL